MGRRGVVVTQWNAIIIGQSLRSGIQRLFGERAEDISWMDNTRGQSRGCCYSYSVEWDIILGTFRGGGEQLNKSTCIYKLLVRGSDLAKDKNSIIRSIVVYKGQIQGTNQNL